MTKEVDKWICTWINLDEIVCRLYRKMKRAKYRPDFIVGISRGGLVPATILSHKFNIPMLPVVWATRDFIDQDYERVDQIRRLVIDEGKSVLIVDDICDSGTTFESFQDCLAEESVSGFAEGVEFCSLYIRYSTEFCPRFYEVEIPDESWIIFPYEVEPQRHSIIDK